MPFHKHDDDEYCVSKVMSLDIDGTCTVTKTFEEPDFRMQDGSSLNGFDKKVHRKKITTRTYKMTEREIWEDRARLREPSHVQGVTPKFNPPAWAARRPGRFPLLSKLRDGGVPPEGTLVRAWSGKRQFGIVGKRAGKVGVFWSSDGWVSDYEDGELEKMFESCIEEVV